MPPKLYVLALLLMLLDCQRREADLQSSNSAYPRWVGDIAPDPNLDDPQFRTCQGEQVYQYFNHSKGLQYKGEKAAIEALFQKQYRPIAAPTATGLIRVRFIVNCAGKTGRFRLQGMNEHYQAMEFPKAISDQLLNLCKQLDGWEKQPNAEAPTDYYQYLTFKIEKGALKEILP